MTQPANPGEDEVAIEVLDVQPDEESREIEANIHSIYDRLPTDRRLQIMIRGANHFQFDDDGAMFKVPLVMAATVSSA